MNWEVIIAAVIGAITGGGISWLFRIKEDKAVSKADVVDSSTDAMNKMMTLISTQQEKLNAIIKDKDKLIEQQQELINGYKTALEEANQKLKNLEFKVSENDRKISGMQKIIEGEISERKKAEHNICFADDCKLRRPKLGTYKKDTA